MIIKEYFYSIECDNCKEIAQSAEDLDAWLSDELAAKENAMETEWHTDGDKHYCPDCYFIDSEDKLIIKQKTYGQ